MRSQHLLDPFAWRLMRCLISLATLGVAGGAAPEAAAVPVVYTAGGQLSASAAGGDTIQINFSTVRLVLAADTADTPVAMSTGGNSVEARYRPSSGSLIFSNRPGGAPDLTIPYLPDLVTVNELAPSTTPDTFELDKGSTDAVPRTSKFFVGGFRVSFLDASFFPGSDPGPLPTFDVTGGAVVFGFFYDQDHFALYTLSTPFVTVDVVPEPGTALLVALGLAALTTARPRRTAA